MPPTPSSLEQGTYAFSPRELQRLAAYRAAVVAHFYTDECDASDTSEWAGPAHQVVSPRSGSDAN